MPHLISSSRQTKVSDLIGGTEKASIQPIQTSAKSLALTLGKCSEAHDFFLRYFGPGEADQNWRADHWPSRLAWLLTYSQLIYLAAEQAPHDFTEWFLQDDAKEMAWLQRHEPFGSAITDAARNGTSCSLLPYLADSYMQRDGRSIRYVEGRREFRQQKRNTGVFYTPSDVSAFVCAKTIRLAGESPTPAICDPACGTGALLLSALRHLASSNRDAIFAIATQSIYGCDLDAASLDAAAFVLLAECISQGVKLPCTPWQAWRMLRNNLVAADATSLAKLTTKPGSRFELRLKSGFDAVILNPPYAQLKSIPGFGQRKSELQSNFECLHDIPLTGNESLVPVFIEIADRLTRPKLGSLGLILPLSISFQSGREYENCRRRLSRSGGKLYLAHFDREPSALFGEDVKTRNVLLFRQHQLQNENSKTALLHTTELLKWRTTERHQLFEKINFCTVGRLDIEAGVPKLSSEGQARAVMRIKRSTVRLHQSLVTLSKAIHADAFTQSHSLYVASTAYNFLSVFHEHQFNRGKFGRLSENPLHRITFKSEKDIDTTFAILNSRLTFWWWRVFGDGFHVGSRFLKELPWGPELFSPTKKAKIATLGRSLWAEMAIAPVISLNAGRTTIAYTASPHDDLRDQIDEALLTELNLPRSFLNELRNIVSRCKTAKTT